MSNVKNEKKRKQTAEEGGEATESGIPFTLEEEIVGHLVRAVVLEDPDAKSLRTRQKKKKK